MNNTTSNNNNTTPTPWIIQRSNPKSFFLKFHQWSNIADKLFNEAPVYKDKKVAVIQLMLINDSYLLAEVLFSE
jgi:hypothetical protein